jgi:hypothetical protein
MFGEIFGAINVETPKYEVLESPAENVEIRKYPAMIMASATGLGGTMDSGMFRTVAGYIFGGNQGGRKIAMTSPVVTESAGTKIAMTAPVVTEASGANESTMSFIMPSEYKKLEDLPVPSDSRVKLHEIPSQTFACITMNGGFWTESNVHTMETKLSDEITKTKWKIVDGAKFKVARFNPPWTLPMYRKTELMIEVSQ